MSNDDVIDKAAALLESAAYQDTDWGPYEIFDSQPKNASWVMIDVSTDGLATDWNTWISYEDDVEMQQAFLGVVKTYLTPGLLNMVRRGELKEVVVKIGPVSLAGVDMNEEHGIEPENLVFVE